jgi:hypothetical protein
MAMISATTTAPTSPKIAAIAADVPASDGVSRGSRAAKFASA